jgi:pimeloyl-ACP methyl ester carboxylesterase
MQKLRPISVAAALVSAAALAAALSACNATQTAQSLTPSASQAFSQPAFATETVARPLAGPNPAWRMLPQTMQVRFARAFPATSDVRPVVTLVLHYPASESAAILHGHGVLVRLDRARQRTFPFVVPDRLDARTRTVTIRIPATLLSGANGLSAGIGVDRRGTGSLPTGPRYWNGAAWSDKGTIDPSKKTLVLIHGIFSSVESAFPASPKPACPNAIATAGGYQQIVGFDYEWDMPPSVEGQLFQKFLNTLAAAGLKSVDVEAHSYGTLVTLAALPGATKKLQIPNAVLLGGPLPLRGTPLALESNAWRMGFVLGALDYAFDYPPSIVDTMINSGMVASMATNSPQLESVLDGVQGMSARPKFVQAAGTKWLCLYAVGSVCFFSEEKFKRVLVEGSGVQLPWDGVVETEAAESTDIPKPAIAKEFPVSHVELECNKDVVKWVGGQVSAG